MQFFVGAAIPSWWGGGGILAPSIWSVVKHVEDALYILIGLSGSWYSMVVRRHSYGIRHSDQSKMYKLTSAREWFKKLFEGDKQNIARSQNAAQSSSHRLLRCQVVLAKRLLLVLSEIELSEFEILSFVTMWVWVLSQFEFYHNLSFIFFWQSEFLSYVAILVLSQFEF